MRILSAAEIHRSLSHYIKLPTPITVGKTTYSREFRTNRLDLLVHLVWRDFAVRYRKSALGVLWSIVPTLTQLLVLVFLFKKVVPLGIEAYPAFVLSALLPWAWFGNCVASSAPLFSNHRDLVRRPNFEPSTLVIVNTLVELINYLVFLPVLLVMLIFYDRSLTPALLFVPVLLSIQFLLIAGISLITASLNVLYGDVKYIVNLAVMLLFYLTPVFYQVEAIGEKYQILYTLNPLAVLIQGYREIFFYGHVPELSALFLAAIASVALWVLGQFIYSRQLSSLYDAL
jgi:ABC-type polysaccharide/polyol phosphate export permease